VARHTPRTGDWFLIGALVLTAGVLGAVSMLAWQLSHLGEVAHLVKSASEHEREPAER
jgi:hypothetical protein